MAIRVVKFFDASYWVQDVALDGLVYTIRARYNKRLDSWFLDVSTVDGIPIALSIRAVIGWPLFYVNRAEPLLPKGELFVLDPAGLANLDPTRESFNAPNALALVYVEERSVLPTV